MQRTKKPTPPTDATQKEPSPLLTPPETAHFLRWTISSVYTAAARRRLPSVKVGGSLRFRRSDLEALVKAGLRSALRPLNTRNGEEAE